MISKLDMKNMICYEHALTAVYKILRQSGFFFFFFAMGVNVMRVTVLVLSFLYIFQHITLPEYKLRTETKCRKESSYGITKVNQ